MILLSPQADEAYSETVLTLTQLRAVPRKVFKTLEWVDVVKVNEDRHLLSFPHSFLFLSSISDLVSQVRYFMCRIFVHFKCGGASTTLRSFDFTDCMKVFCSCCGIGRTCIRPYLCRQAGLPEKFQW